MREFVVIAAMGSVLATAMAGPAFALTAEEKKGIMTRCTAMEGEFWACCAAANGTKEIQGKPPNTFYVCTLPADRKGAKGITIRGPSALEASPR